MRDLKLGGKGVDRVFFWSFRICEWKVSECDFKWRIV